MKQLESTCNELAKKNSELSVNHSVLFTKNSQLNLLLNEEKSKGEINLNELHRFEVKNKQLTNMLSEIRTKKEDQESQFKGRIEELELSNQQLRLLHNNSKQHLTTVMNQNSELIKKSETLEQQFNQLRTSYDKETRVTKELLADQKVCKIYYI